MGEINLNSFVYNDMITKQDLFSALSQEEIFSFYMGETVTHNTLINSPLREDNVPSFAIYYHKNNSGVLMFHDFATGESGDVVIFVLKMFDLSYYEALWKIAYDFKLSNVEVTAERKKIITAKKVKAKELVKIGIKRRKWLSHDATFWKQFGITKRTLEMYNVVPISYVFFNGGASKVDKHAYAYIEYKDGKYTYKIYQPYSKDFKWINNANHSVHQGYTQLPSTYDKFIITKSLKDVMSLRDVMMIPSVGLQSESVMMKDSVMDEYKSRFKKVVCLFDNDAAGIRLSEEFSKRYDVPHIYVPRLNDNVSDFSDLVKEVGLIEAKEIFKGILNEIRW
jgi:hypothetical protein